MGDIELVETYFEGLQKQVCEAFEEREDSKKFSVEEFGSEKGGFGKPRVIDDGVHVERGAVLYTYTKGTNLPAAATERNAYLKGKSDEAERRLR